MAKPGWLSAAVLKQIILSYTYVVTWMTLSCGVILYNKYILDRNMYNWPYPITLTMIHMAFCSALAFLIVRVLGRVPSANMPLSIYLKSVVPIGVLYALSLWASNSAYIYLSVSFIQMLKALTPVAVYSWGILLKKDPFKPSVMLNMVAISVGVAIAAYGEAKFDVLGVVIQLCAVLFEAARLVIIELLLKSKGITLNAITTLYYVAPSCLLFLSIPWFIVEYPALREASSWNLDLFTFGTNAVWAFGLNLAVFLIVSNLSALTMNVAGVVKDWILIGISWSVIKDRVTPVNLMGYVVALLGVLYYQQAKLQAMKKAVDKEKEGQGEGDVEGGRLLEEAESDRGSLDKKHQLEG
ncbi:hypothetical protein RJ640_018119 [Escallonia rubra]|uniref:Sugar phosphate transporter domain-containing protein n=1 Tax=Escallonia rubra TaxID=112253 RepID=A0AA88QH13_9ASTE|nr:hypothetical protein RJ640_018119 [Escallonia rubra]